MVEDDSFYFVASIVLAIVAIIILFWWSDSIAEVKAELGQAICEEEYDMDYKSYNNKVLECQPKRDDYDSIQIKIDYVGG